ncbi:uncharacterized protein LOC110933896 [Helianthus annuus]|uniref:uncharacterized protein LOC110933896 n=1 Tax=Helianthus annuus TaxID=4232 RepID=UPI000B8EFF40|nr:uncharacterized protein LOC110933896 [Helianthus annuus]
MWAYCTAFATPIGTTPYRLVYGKGCHLPMEITHLALWAVKQVNTDYTDEGAHRQLKLWELKELRNEDYDIAPAYKDNMKVVHDAKLRCQVFAVGQKVWLFNSRHKLFPGKLKSKWMGPFVIIRMGKFREIEIEDMKDQKRQVVNGHRLKSYLHSDDLNTESTDEGIPEIQPQHRASVGKLETPSFLKLKSYDFDLNLFITVEGWSEKGEPEKKRLSNLNLLGMCPKSEKQQGLLYGTQK